MLETDRRCSARQCFLLEAPPLDVGFLESVAGCCRSVMAAIRPFFASRSTVLLSMTVAPAGAPSIGASRGQACVSFLGFPAAAGAHIIRQRAKFTNWVGEYRICTSFLVQRGGKSVYHHDSAWQRRNFETGNCSTGNGSIRSGQSGRSGRDGQSTGSIKSTMSTGILTRPPDLTAVAVDKTGNGLGVRALKDPPTRPFGNTSRQVL